MRWRWESCSCFIWYRADAGVCGGSPKRCRCSRKGDTARPANGWRYSKRLASFRDEIDLLYDTALTLSHQLEEADQALSAKNRELAEERDFMQGVLDAAQVLVVTQNRYGIIQMANKFAAQVTGFSTVKLQGRRFVDLIADVEAHQEVLSKLEDLYARGQRRADHEHDSWGAMAPGTR